MMMAVGHENEIIQQNLFPSNGSSRLSVEIHMDQDSSSSRTSDDNNRLVVDAQDRPDLGTSPRNAERLSEYELSSQLGDGAYGTVLLAIHRRTNQTVAIKRMKNTYLTWKDALKEMEIVVAGELKRHPNIIHMLEAFREAQQLYMVFEYMDCNLYQLMKDRSIKRFTEDETRSITGQIFCGLQYLHEKGYFHRDLKPENILCNGTEVIKIADFGQARQIRSRPPYTEYVSTRWYRAPELVLSSKIYSLGVDIWAVGCIMAEVVTLRPLFDGATAADQLFKIVKLLGTPRRDDWPQGFDMADRIKMSFPPGFERQNLSLFIKPASPSCEEVVAATLQYNPQSRPSAKTCLQMPFFSKPTAGRRPWEATTTTEKSSTYRRQGPITETRPKAEVLPKIPPESNVSLPNDKQTSNSSVPSKPLPGVREIAQLPTGVAIPGQGNRRRAGEPTGKFSYGSNPTEQFGKKQNLFRRHESQNIIPVTKYTTTTLTNQKGPVLKFAAQNNLEKVSKSSTSPNLLAQTSSGELLKSRFRTTTDPATTAQQQQPLPAKFGHMQRILLPRRESRKTLDPHHSTDLGSRRLLEANRVLRKLSSETDGPSRGLGVQSSPTIDEFPDPFVAADDSKGDRRLGGRPVVDVVTTITTGPEKVPWMGGPLADRTQKFSMQKSASPFFIRPSVQLNGTVSQAAAPTSDRPSQAPTWWDK